MVSKSLQIHDTIRLDELERFADWQEWGFAIAESLKVGLGKQFLEDIKKNVIRQDEEVIENNVLMQMVIQFIDNQKDNEWLGTTKELLHELQIIEVDYNTKVLSTPSVLSKSLGEQLSVFENQGISIERGIKGTNNKRMIKIVKKT